MAFELHDAYAGKGTTALDATPADSGQTWRSAFTSVAGHGLSIISNQVTMTPTTHGAGYAQAPLTGPVTRMGAKFTFDSYTTLLGTIVLLNLQKQLTDLADTTIASSCHLAIRPTAWILSVITGGSSIPIASGGYSQNLTCDGTTVYQAGWVIIGQTAFLALPDGSTTEVTDSRISSLQGPWCVFEVIISNDNTDAKGRFTEVWADTVTPRRAAVNLGTAAIGVGR